MKPTTDALKVGNGVALVPRALPARAIRCRLAAAAEAPSWSAYLPPGFISFQIPPSPEGEPGSLSVQKNKALLENPKKAAVPVGPQPVATPVAVAGTGGFSSLAARGDGSSTGGTTGEPEVGPSPSSPKAGDLIWSKAAMFAGHPAEKPRSRQVCEEAPPPPAVTKAAAPSPPTCYQGQSLRGLERVPEGTTLLGRAPKSNGHLAEAKQIGGLQVSKAQGKSIGVPPGPLSTPESAIVEKEDPSKAVAIDPVPLPTKASAVAGRVWALAKDPRGCREVQHVISMASEEEKESLAVELWGHVWEAVRCPHANHVLQKFIVSLEPEASDFVIDELMRCSGGSGGAAQAARHRYGCRILERLIEHCHSDQLQNLVEELMTDAVTLCKHPYANYVMQHLVEHGAPIIRQQIISVLEKNAALAGSDCYARAVISKALTYGAYEDQVALARALLKEPGLLATMARTRHGHVAAKFALQQLDGAEKEVAAQQLQDDIQALRASRYGRFVAACLDAAHQQDGDSAGHLHAIGGG